MTSMVTGNRDKSNVHHLMGKKSKPKAGPKRYKGKLSVQKVNELLDDVSAKANRRHKLLESKKAQLRWKKSTDEEKLQIRLDSMTVDYMPGLVDRRPIKGMSGKGKKGGGRGAGKGKR